MESALLVPSAVSGFHCGPSALKPSVYAECPLQGSDKQETGV